MVKSGFKLVLFFVQSLIFVLWLPKYNFLLKRYIRPIFNVVEKSFLILQGF